MFKIKFLLCVGLIYFPTLTFAETDQELLLSGQWRDPSTNLIWMRCSVGQKWTGQTCAGVPAEFEHDASRDFVQNIPNGTGFANHTNWRIPRVAELASIRYCSSGWFMKSSKMAASIEDGNSMILKKEPVLTTLPYNNPKYPNIERIVTPNKCDEQSIKPTIRTDIFKNFEQKTKYGEYNVWGEEHGVHGYMSYSASFYNGYVGEMPDDAGSFYRILLVRDPD